MTNMILVLAAISTVVVSVCGASEGSDVNHGVQVLGKLLIHFLNSQPEDVKISDGVHLVNTRSVNDARSLNRDKTVWWAVENYLQSHEIRIRLPELMPGEEFGRSFREAVDGLDDTNEVVEGRRKKGGGGGMGGGMMMMGLMMGKLLAALGIGGVALLAKKALLVSALALMLSVIIGLKKLVHSGGDEGGHHVIHAGHGGGHEYRRKRDVFDLAYNAWDAYNKSK